MKYFVNILTALRILGAICLLFLEPLSGLFFAVYVFCGFSDILDGYLARKTNSATVFGAIFDSIADFIFIGVMLLVLLPILQLTLWIKLWVAGIALIKAVSLLTGAVKYRSLAFLHTYMNKITGALLFLFPLLYSFVGLTVTAILLCSAATLGAIEELVINLRSREIAYDVKSLFIKVPSDPAKESKK